MPKHSVTTGPLTSAGPEADGDWAQLQGDCARMVPHWAVPATVAERVPASLIHGVVVPSASARLVGAMPEYGA
ncbi:hypothetical protein ACFYVL_23285 [Streptomyces sp. NPDC004111]|uniref:hypothetical protein n=1 Tax=Streptomyces sp. NPDC004111 TaxID=3364690 RepID=UPI0036A1C3A9